MSVALDISSKSIKIVALQGKRIKKWAMADLPEGMVKEGLILQPKAIAKTVNDLFKTKGFSRDGVILGIAGLSFTYRFLTLPRMKPSLLEEAIIRAARKEISLPLEDLYLSWQQLPDTNGELSFFIIGVPRKFVDAALEMLKAANIEPYLMGLRPLAIARASERSDAIIVNLDPCGFDIVIMSGGIPRVIHTLAPRSQDATLEDNILRLATELNKTTAFFQSNNPDVQLDTNTPLLLTGELLANTATTALLQTEVDYPISPLVILTEVPQGMSRDSYAATIGLAFKKSPPKTAVKTAKSSFVDVNVNILAGKYRKPKAKPVSLTRVLLWLLLAAVIILLYPLYQARTQAAVKNTALGIQVMDVSRQIDLAKFIHDDYLAKQETIQAIQKETAALKHTYASTAGSRGEFTAELTRLTSLLPENVIFTALDITRNAINIQGEADNSFTVIKYAQALEAEGVYKEVRINSLIETVSMFYVADNPEAPPPENITQFEIVITKNSPVAMGD